jgi:hypothetical protein
VATWLGVGYSALVTHRQASLGLLERRRADSLGKTDPKKIKTGLLGKDFPEHLVVADDHWQDSAIDIQVGDVILCPPSVVCEGGCVAPDKSFMFGAVLRGTKPGRGRVLNLQSGWASFVRVSRQGFAGRARFRHLEETEDEDDPAVH